MHGLLGDVDLAELAELPSKDKVPYALRMMDGARLSPRMAASLVEVGNTLATWPQLVAEVAQSATLVAEAVRRIGLGEELASGRVRIDVAARASTRSMTPPHRTDHRRVARRADRPHTDGRRRAGGRGGGSRAVRWKRPALAHFDAGRCGHHCARTRTHVDDGRRLSGERRRGRRGGVQRPGGSGCRRNPRAGALHPVTTRARCAPSCTSRMDSDPGAGRRCTNRCSRGKPTATAASRSRCPTTSPKPCRRRRRARARDCTFSPRSDDVDKAAAILGESDRIRYLTPRLHAEMISEVRWPGDGSPDSGIDVRSLELDPADLVKLDVLRRPEVMAYLAEWDAGAALAPTPASASWRARVSPSCR